MSNFFNPYNDPIYRQQMENMADDLDALFFEAPIETLWVGLALIYILSVYLLIG
jgi:hypothetical protein